MRAIGIVEWNLGNIGITGGIRDAGCGRRINGAKIQKRAKAGNIEIKLARLSHIVVKKRHRKAKGGNDKEAESETNGDKMDTYRPPYKPDSLCKRLFGCLKMSAICMGRFIGGTRGHGRPFCWFLIYFLVTYRLLVDMECSCALTITFRPPLLKCSGSAPNMIVNLSPSG